MSRTYPSVRRVWFLGVDDAAADVVHAEMTRLFPGYEGLAGLYVIEDAYRQQAVVELV